MNGLLSVYKNRSETPLQTIHRVKEALGLSEKIKIGYAGRLDPLASGVLLLMIGDECKKRDRYQNLDKEYKFKILFGASTDSLDPMGKISCVKSSKIALNPEKFNNIVKIVQSQTQQKIPLYSSYRIEGQPMFKLAREELIGEGDRPSKNVEVRSLSFVDDQYLDRDQIVSKFVNEIDKTRGLFRQKQIVKNWKEVSDKLPKDLLVVVMKTRVSSGTYVRVIGEDICKLLKVPGLVFDIERKSVGKFSSAQSIKI